VAELTDAFMAQAPADGEKRFFESPKKGMSSLRNAPAGIGLRSSDRSRALGTHRCEHNDDRHTRPQHGSLPGAQSAGSEGQRQTPRCGSAPPRPGSIGCEAMHSIPQPPEAAPWTEDSFGTHDRELEFPMVLADDVQRVHRPLDRDGHATHKFADSRFRGENRTLHRDVQRRG
jgi:hypothetical protein